MKSQNEKPGIFGMPGFFSKGRNYILNNSDVHPLKNEAVKPSLRQNVVDDFSMNIGETELPALEFVGQFLVVDPHLV